MVEIIDARRRASRARARVLIVLRRGGILIFPTDTVYGIGGDALRPGVARRLRNLKKRSSKKAFPWLVSDLAMAKQYAHFTKETEVLARSVWPGATTLVLLKRKGRGTIALRIPGHHWLRVLIRKFGRPLLGTSANRSGKKPFRTAKQAATFFGRVDLAIDGGECGTRPSRILDCTTSTLKRLR